MKFIILAAALLAFQANAQSGKSYVQQAVNVLNEIQSASYLARHTVSAPGDSVDFKTLTHVEKEFANRADPTIGSTYVWFVESASGSDTTHLDLFYNGTARGYFNWKKKIVSVDSFRNNRHPFRPVGPPFFNYAHSILKYALEPLDEITLTVTDFHDSVRVRVDIHHELVDFFGNDIAHGDRTILDNLGADFKSRYDIWFHKSTNLPYRINRKVGESKSYYRVTNVRINREHLDDFSVMSYIPKDFSIQPFGAVVSRSRKLINDLLDTQAPEWNILDTNGNFVSLSSLRRKVVVIEFTGIGCGPCHQAMPFLKQWAEESRGSNFELVGIETWSKNHEGVKRYFQNNAINYTFLKADPAVVESYRVYGAPVFFILDEKRVIRKIISGYEKGKTDNKLREAVNELL
jgi:thiol-disulfide isomerase/thioredoxin